MFQRTVYSAIMGVAAILGIVSAFLPWAEREFVEVQRDNVASVGEIAPGVEVELGAFALVVCFLLLGLVVWFWVDSGSARVRLASMLIIIPAAFLASIPALAVLDIDTFVPSLDYHDPHDQLSAAVREGAYMTGAAGLVAGLAAVAAVMFYRPARDREAPAFQTARWLLVTPVIGYLLLTAWNEAGLPFPSVSIPLVTYKANFPIPFRIFDDARLWDPAFRRLVAAPALVALVVGMAIGLARPRLRAVPLVASGTIAIAYVAFLVYDGVLRDPQCRLPCYAPPSYLNHLQYYFVEYTSPVEQFSITGEVLAITSLAMVLSLWVGVGLTEMSKQLAARSRAAFSRAGRGS